MRMSDGPAGGKSCSSPAASSASRVGGKSTVKVMTRSPNSDETPCLGIPSPLILMLCPGLVTPLLLMVTVWPSRCVKEVSKPSSAARSGIAIFIESVSRLRLKNLCATGFSLKTTSPGIWPGFCSDSYLKVICSESGIPFSIVALSDFSSRLHFSFDSTITSCCTIMPGPARRWTIFFSFGQAPHPWQRGTFGFFLQFRQTIRRLMVADFSLPMYKSSSVTGKSISVFRPRFDCSLPPPPPKNMSKGEPPPSCSCAPLRAAPMPPKSYSTRLSLSAKISYASVTSRKRPSVEPSGFLSGWSWTESLR
mmetsp:Transcript_22547/g.72658  ORF Transcript_22547/g.72658 Transcript_22547/m.72658 type:complete len:307 (-) Transcript_22547:300-1220(-)